MEKEEEEDVEHDDGMKEPILLGCVEKESFQFRCICWQLDDVHWSVGRSVCWQPATNANMIASV